MRSKLGILYCFNGNGDHFLKVLSPFFSLQADIIVNTISEDLDLSKGAVSRALLQTAGHQLQSEINRAAHSDNLNYGEMVITDGYNLNCSKVFHVVCPVWNGGQDSADRVRHNLPQVIFIFVFQLIIFMLNLN